MHRSHTTFFALAFIGLATLLSAPTHAQLLTFALTPDPATGPVGAPIDFDLTYLNLNQTSATFGSPSVYIKSSPTLTVTFNDPSIHTIPSDNGGLIDDYLTATPTALGTYTLVINETVNGVTHAQTVMAQVMATPPPPAMLIALVGGAFMAFRSRVSRRKRAA